MTPELWTRLTRRACDDDLRDCPDCRGRGYAGEDDEHPCHECSGSGGVPGEWEFHAFGPVRVEVADDE
jgi:DnaJ-class molecular chaperone